LSGDALEEAAMAGGHEAIEPDGPKPRRGPGGEVAPRDRVWRLLPLVSLAAAVILWGTSFVATKAALAGFGPMTIIAIRMLVATAMMAPLWRVIPAPERRSGDWRWLGLIALLYPCLYYALETNALQLTTASQAGAVSALVPLFVAVGARTFLGERVSGRAVVGLVTSLTGVVALSVAAPVEAASPAPALGNALEVLALASYAVSMLALKRLTSRYDPWFLTGLQCLVGAVVFLPALVLMPLGDWGRVPGEAWLGLLFLGIMVTLLPAGLYNFALSRMEAGRSALAINLVPVVALTTGWAILGDQLNVIQLAACALVLGGVVAGQTSGAPKVAAVVSG
jgi:drug/metabolite transporter (DMT)-like permease